MQRKYMIPPNAVVLACAAILFHRPFLSGHITWIGSLVILSALLPLAYCLVGRMPRFLKYLGALLNAIFLLNCGYAVVGTVHMLAKTGALDWRFFVMAGALWAFSLAGVFSKTDRTGKMWAGSLNIALCVIGALALYVRSASAWMPWMTAVLFAAFIAVAGLNICLLVNLFAFRRSETHLN